MEGGKDLNDNEKQLVKPYFSNVDKNIYVLTNLPEVIMGTLFSRYSRSDKTARRLLLDEFLQNKDISAIIGTSGTPIETLNLKKAEDFYNRVLVGYGDDSVAELAGVHIACENISSLAADILTDSRVGISPLEKSARYVLFDKKIDGKYLWYEEPTIMASKHADVYRETMDLLFDSYVKWLPIVTSYVREVTPKQDDTTQRAYENATRAKACDILKNLLPAGRLTNIGLFGNGRAFEHLLTRLYSYETKEAELIANEMTEELAKVIPSFVKRAEKSPYVTSTRHNMESFFKNLPEIPPENITGSYTKLVEYDKDGENSVLAAMLYSYSSAPFDKLLDTVRGMSPEQKEKLINSYMSGRRHRRDKPGRAYENLFYTFEICSNYGMFRDLHRHRQLSMGREMLTTDLGYDMPKELHDIGLAEEFSNVLNKAKIAHDQIRKDLPFESQYIVPRAYRMRWYMKMNLREVYHITELRSSKQGHPDYRKIAQQMKVLVDKVHPLLTRYSFVDMNEYALPRLESEKRIDQKLAMLDKKEEDNKV